MALIKSVVITMENGKKANQLSNGGKPYYFCTWYTIGSQKFQGAKTPDGEPVEGATSRTTTIQNIFGADLYSELEAEIIRLGLIE